MKLTDIACGSSVNPLRFDVAFTGKSQLLNNEINNGIQLCPRMTHGQPKESICVLLPDDLFKRMKIILMITQLKHLFPFPKHSWSYGIVQ